jgi:hypothetical protein
MGTTLTGTTPQDTYDSLIKVTDNGPISGTLKALSDGLGNDSTLSLSTTAASIAGTLAVTGSATFSSTTAVASAGGTSQMRIDRSGTVARMQNYDTGQAANISLQHDGGNVGIGTSSPDSKLNISGGATRALRLDVNSGVQAFSVGSVGIFGLDAAGVGNGRFIITELGDVGIGTPTPSVKLDVAGLVAGNGFKFPATQAASADANTLDDYEEGTWTMGVSFGGASVGVTTSANTGTYTKIGRQVTVNGFLILTNKGSSTGAAAITGLPFAIGVGNSYQAPSSLRFQNITFADQYQGFGEQSFTKINLEEITILGVASSITDADFANNSNVMVSLTYFV